MRDDPRRNLKWMEQELLAEDRIHRDFSKLPDQDYHEDADLLELVDQLIGEEEEEETPPVRNFANNDGRQPKSVRAERAYQAAHFDKSTAVLTKTKQQLRREARHQKIAGKKANVNHNITGLVFLAILEMAGILAILGWWVQ